MDKPYRRTYVPARPLGEFVDLFWHYDGYFPPQMKEAILPDGTMALAINLRDDELRVYDAANPARCERFSGMAIAGTYRGAFLIDTAQQNTIMGAHFRPGGAFPFLDLPVGELADRHVDLEAIWGSAAADLRERLCEADTPDQRFRILEEALLAHLCRPFDRHDAVRIALGAFRRFDVRVTVRDVARRVGLSHRRFNQVFTAEVGLTPKMFSRLQRFQRVLALVRGTATPDWARLSVDCGYFDQSHLIRDFREFSGLVPTNFLRRRSGEHPNHFVPE
jgi:AraC-like DNA-binding protein